MMCTLCICLETLLYFNFIRAQKLSYGTDEVLGPAEIKLLYMSRCDLMEIQSI